MNWANFWIVYFSFMTVGFTGRAIFLKKNRVQSSFLMVTLLVLIQPLLIYRAWSNESISPYMNIIISSLGVVCAISGIVLLLIIYQNQKFNKQKN